MGSRGALRPGASPWRLCGFARNRFCLSLPLHHLRWSPSPCRGGIPLRQPCGLPPPRLCFAKTGRIFLVLPIFTQCKWGGGSRRRRLTEGVLVFIRWRARTVTPWETWQIARPERRLLALRGRRCAASGRVAGWDSTPDPAQPVVHRRRRGFGRRLANGPKTVPAGTPNPSSAAGRWMPGSRAWGFVERPFL